MKKVFFSLFLIVVLSAVILAHYRFHNSTRESKQGRIYIIGLDGASWNLMNPLMKEGKLPNLRKLKESGVYGNLQSTYPAHSAFLWTTIATGKTKEKHGIGDFVVKEDEGITPTTGNLRRVKAFWNILSERGIPVTVVNWWVTWPPEKVKGIMISDRYRLARYKAMKMQVAYPTSLQDKLPFPEISKERAAREWKTFRLPDLYDVTQDGRITAFDKALRNYPQYWCQDASVWNASRYVLKNYPTTVFAVVFRIIDISSHFFWCYLPLDLLAEVREKASAETLTQQDIDRLDARFAQIIEPVYSYADRIVGQIMDSAPPGSTFIVVSDHGFAFYKTSYSHTTQRIPPSGILILKGGPYRKGVEIQGASIYDITPTLLYQLHLPVAKDFDGKVLSSAFRSEFTGTYQIVSIPTWETGNRPTDQKPIHSETDEETLEDLRALGYIQQ